MGSSKDLPAVCVWIRDGVLPDPDNVVEARSFATAAARQGLIAWLDEVIPAHHTSWSRELRDDLRAAHLRTLAEGVRRCDLARRAQQLLDARGLRSLVLKGAALVETHYPSPAHRPMSDVDLLALDQPSEARRLLLEAGFKEQSAGDHACALQDPEGAGTLELHHSLTSCPGLFPMDADAAWRDHIDTPAGLHVAAAEPLLVQLALHATFQHGLALSVVQYLDFRRVLERPLDVDRVLRAADATGAREALRLALEAAAAVVGAVPPRALAEALRGPRPRWLARRLQEPVRCVEPAPPALVPARWRAARGRRLQLLRLTLAGPPGTPGLSTWTRGWSRVTRAAGLARWVLRGAR
jgi:hypothetical protein